jgi:hypothetical protein
VAKNGIRRITYSYGRETEQPQMNADIRRWLSGGWERGRVYTKHGLMCFFRDDMLGGLARGEYATGSSAKIELCRKGEAAKQQL